MGVVRFESGALGVCTRRRPPTPGSQRPGAGPRRPGLGGHRQRPAGLLPRTPAGEDPEERSYGDDVRPDRGGRRGDGRQQPDRPRRLAPAAVPQLPGRARRDASSCGSTWRPTGRPSPSSTACTSPRAPGAGEAAMIERAQRIAANPIPYWAEGRQDPGGVRGGVPRLPGDRLHRRQGGRARGHDAGGVRRLDRRVRPGAVAEPVQLAVRRDGRHVRRGGAAKRFAADQVALGLDRTMVSSMAVPARLARPAVGADFDEGRLVPAIDNVRAGVRGPAGRRAAAAAPLARRRGLRDRGRDRPAARRPRPGRHRLRPGHRAPAVGRDRPGDVHPPLRRPDRAASTSRTASPTSSTPRSRGRA